MTPAAIRASARQGRTPLGTAVERLLQHYLATVVPNAAAAGHSTGGATQAERRAACARWILLGIDGENDSDPPFVTRELLLRHWVEEHGGDTQQFHDVAFNDKADRTAARNPASAGTGEALRPADVPRHPYQDDLDWISQGPCWMPVAERIRLRDEVYGTAPSKAQPPAATGSDVEQRTGVLPFAEDLDCGGVVRETVAEQSRVSRVSAGEDRAIQRVGTLIGLVSSLAFLWLQFGGIWHAFKGHGTGPGVVAVMAPPVAWFFAIEFFFHSLDNNEEPRAGRSDIYQATTWEEIDGFLASPMARKAAQHWGTTVEEMRRQYDQLRRAGFYPDPGGDGWRHPDGRRVDGNGVGWWPDGRRAGTVKDAAGR